MRLTASGAHRAERQRNPVCGDLIESPNSAKLSLNFPVKETNKFPLLLKPVTLQLNASLETVITGKLLWESPSQSIPASLPGPLL